MFVKKAAVKLTPAAFCIHAFFSRVDCQMRNRDGASCFPADGWRSGFPGFLEAIVTMY